MKRQCIEKIVIRSPCKRFADCFLKKRLVGAGNPKVNLDRLTCFQVASSLLVHFFFDFRENFRGQHSLIQDEGAGKLFKKQGWIGLG